MTRSNQPLYSTNIDPQYLRSNYITNVKVNINGKKEFIPDFFNPNYVNLINNLIPFDAIRYVKRLHVPNISYKKYNNTSAWWMIMAINGYIYESQIVEGSIVLLPDVKTAKDTSVYSSTRQISIVTV